MIYHITQQCAGSMWESEIGWDLTRRLRQNSYNFVDNALKFANLYASGHIIVAENNHLNLFHLVQQKHGFLVPSHYLNPQEYLAHICVTRPPRIKFNSDRWKNYYKTTNERNLQHRYISNIQKVRCDESIPMPTFILPSDPHGQNGDHFTGDIFRCIFVNEKLFYFD